MLRRASARIEHVTSARAATDNAKAAQLKAEGNRCSLRDKAHTMETSKRKSKDDELTVLNT